MIKKTILIYLLLLLAMAFGDFQLPEPDFAPEFSLWHTKEHLRTSGFLQIGDKSVSLGDSHNRILELFGEAQAILPSEYGFSWYIYHEDYKNYIQIGFRDDRVVALYTNANTFSLAGLTLGMSRDDARIALGAPVYVIDKPDARYRVVQEADSAVEGDMFYCENAYLRVFYDIFKHDSVTALHIIDRDTELAFGLYGAPSEALAESFELQNFYVTNALRVREGKTPLIYSEALSEVARRHAADMAQNEYFSHENPEGLLAHERIDRAGIRYSSAGENLAMGSQNSLIMHELLMNSEGHRKNILADYEYLGVGVAIRADGVPYLAQNYTTPLRITMTG